MDAKNIGVFLQGQRKQNNLTQKDISKLCNVSTQAVSKWERGESIPDIEILERLSILYKISINELINGEREELFMDIEKRRVILSLTSSILVFMAYLFNFLKTSSPFANVEVILKGYEVIFDGVGGRDIVISWVIFMVLVAHLIINIFVITKVVERSRNISNFFFGTSIAGVILSTFLGSNFIVFPQLIILTGLLTILFLNYDGQFNIEPFKIKVKNIKSRFSKFNNELNNYKKLKKNKSNIDQFVIETENNKNFLLAIKVILAILTVFYVFLTFAYFATLIADFIRGENYWYTEEYIAKVIWYGIFSVVLIKIFLLRNTVFLFPILKRVLLLLIFVLLPGFVVTRIGLDDNFFTILVAILEIALLILIYIYKNKIEDK